MTASTPSLGWYVEHLVGALEAGEPEAFDRMRHVAGSQRALVALGSEAIVVRFDDHGRLDVEPVEPVEPGPIDDEPLWSGIADATLDGVGRTDHDVVVAILDGRLEATDAILDGDIEMRGSTAAVTAMLIAIEILIDAAPRVPAIRRLAEGYREVHPAPADLAVLPRRRRTSWPPSFFGAAEDAMLAAAGLDNGAGSSTMDQRRSQR